MLLNKFIIPARKKSCFKFYKINCCREKNCFYFKDRRKPFFQIINESGTAGFFIDAMIKNSICDAENYLSKIYSCELDWEKVKNIFKNAERYKYFKNSQRKTAEGYKIDSVIIIDRKSKKKEIIHFYMVNEPDNYSKWKIFKITKEG